MSVLYSPSLHRLISLLFVSKGRRPGRVPPCHLSAVTSRTDSRPARSTTTINWVTYCWKSIGRDRDHRKYSTTTLYLVCENERFLRAIPCLFKGASRRSRHDDCQLFRPRLWPRGFAGPPTRPRKKRKHIKRASFPFYVEQEEPDGAACPVNAQVGRGNLQDTLN